LPVVAVPRASGMLWRCLVLLLMFYVSLLFMDTTHTNNLNLYNDTVTPTTEKKKKKKKKGLPTYRRR
jgi:hypothetical protein